MPKTTETPVFQLFFEPRTSGGYSTLDVHVTTLDGSRVHSNTYHTLRDFGFKVQMDQDKHTYYAWEWNGPTFIPSDRVGIDDARRYVKVGTRVKRALDKLYQDLGPAADFAEFLARVAKALKIKQAIEYDRTRGQNSWDLQAYKVYTIPDLVYRIRSAEAQWAEQCAKAKAVSA